MISPELLPSSTALEPTPEQDQRAESSLMVISPSLGISYLEARNRPPVELIKIQILNMSFLFLPQIQKFKFIYRPL